MPRTATRPDPAMRMARRTAPTHDLAALRRSATGGAGRPAIAAQPAELPALLARARATAPSPPMPPTRCARRWTPADARTAMRRCRPRPAARRVRRPARPAGGDQRRDDRTGRTMCWTSSSARPRRAASTSTAPPTPPPPTAMCSTCAAHGIGHVVKSKTMVSEEIELNAALEAARHPRRRDRPGRVDPAAGARAALAHGHARPSTRTAPQVGDLFSAGDGPPGQPRGHRRAGAAWPGASCGATSWRPGWASAGPTR